MKALFSTSNIPVSQNRMFDDRESAITCKTGDVVLVQNQVTGLISNVTFDPSLLDYDANYQNEQACSKIFQEHIDDVAEIVERNFRNKNLIEVGCGKGYFLEHLRGLGYEITGIDPAYEGSKPYIICSLFTKEVGLSADGIILRHVLEHVPDPIGFLSDVACANGGQGHAYIEVPCFDWICKHKAWFDIFYEHVNYFRLSDFSRMFGHVIEAGHTFGGQYLFAVVDLSTLRSHVCDIEEIHFPEDIMSNTRKLIETCSTEKRKAVWGGASKGMMFALYLQRQGFEIGTVIDINPAKQGKYLAGTGIQVCSPDEGLMKLEEGDEIFVMNSNYYSEIVNMAGTQYKYLKADKL